MLVWGVQKGNAQSNLPGLFAEFPTSLNIDSARAHFRRVPIEHTPQVDECLQIARVYLSYQPDTSLSLTRTALNYAQRYQYWEGIAHSNLLLGQVFANYSAYATAAEHYYTALEIYQSENNLLGLINTKNALGELYYYTRQLSEALKEHEGALHIAQRQNFRREEALTLGYIGHFYEKQLDYTKALNYQQLALNRYQELNDAKGLSTIYGHIGSIYEDLADYERAYEYFSKALTYNLQTEDEEGRIIHLNNLGDVFRKKGKYEEAFSYSEQAERLASKLDNSYQLKSAKRDLSKVYSEVGQFEKAFNYMSDAYDINEKLYDTEGANQIARMQTLYEINQTQRELDNLKKDQRLERTVRWALIAGLGMLLALFLLVLNRQRLKIRKNRELWEARQALTQQALENSQLREKQLQSDLEARATELSTHALNIVQKNKILKDLKTQLTHLQQHHKPLRKPVSQLIQKIDQSFHFDKDWKKFNQIFEQVHPEFYRQLRDQFPDLTSAEIRLAALLRLNLEPRDIASILGISLDSLRVSRYRLRKKLNLDRSINLVAFIMKV